MVGVGKDFISEEDYNVILDLLSGDLLNEDKDYLTELEETEIGVTTFKCSFCEKICKSKQGLSRHTNIKHPSSSSSSVVNSTKRSQCYKEPELILPPKTYTSLVNKCVSSLSQDECYSKKTMSFFKNYILTEEESLVSYNEIRDVIKNFNGNGEKFYPIFYKIVCDKNIFPRLSNKCSRLLGVEVANYVLAHITSYPCDSKTSVVEKQCEFNEKEMDIITYLSGYVFSTLYKRLRCSKNKTDITEKYLSLLLAGKSTSLSESTQTNEKLIEARDRGGLWKVVPQVVAIVAFLKIFVYQNNFQVDLDRTVL